MAHASSEGGRFVWPPREGGAPVEPDAPAPPSPKPTRRTPGLSRLKRLLLDLERDWLDPVAPPLPVRMERDGWSPDAPGAYCDRCGMSVGPHEADEFGCAACREVRWPWDRFVRLGEYREPLSSWIVEVKFTRFATLGVGLGRLLGERIREANPGPRAVAVVPVPSSMTRRVRRGIDHAGAIALGASRGLRAPLVRALAARGHPPQHTLPRSERSRLSGRVFRPVEGIRLEGWTVVLIDDVRTSGATLAAASRAIRRGWPGAHQVWAAAVAATPESNRRRGGAGAMEEASSTGSPHPAEASQERSRGEDARGGENFPGCGGRGD